MKKLGIILLKVVLIFITSALISYSIGALAAGFDMTKWSQDARSVCAVFTGILWITGCMVTFLEADNISEW